MVLLAIACQPLESRVQRKGPMVTLSAEAPVVERVITACLDGPDVGHVSAEVRALVDLAMPVGAPGSRAKGRIVGAGPGRGFEIQQGRTERLVVDLVARGPWTGQTGFRCAEPQTIRFELEPSDETVELSLEWTAEFGVYQGGLGCGKNAQDLEPSIEIAEGPAR